MSTPAYEFEFHPAGDAPDDPAPVKVVISDDELREIGWLVDTKELSKIGWEDKYLACLSVSGERVASADEAGISIRRINDRIKNDPIFAELHEQALARRDALLDDMAANLALHGVPTTYKRKDGTVVTERRVDTRFLEFYLDRKIPGFKADRDTLGKALEGGITVNFQIGERPPTPAAALPSSDVEVAAEEISEADTSESDGTS